MIKRIKREISLFKSLGRDTYLLVLSNFTEKISGTLIYIFVNAYMFTRTDDVRSVVIMNLGFFITMVIGFYLNAILLKKIKIKTIFAPSLVMRGMSMLVLFFINDLNLIKIFLIGLLYGLFSGLYWANRNFAFPALTNDNNRNYISGISAFIGNISSVLLPILAGWFIVWAELQANINSEFAYKVIIFLSVILLLVGSVLISYVNLPSPKINKLFIRGKISRDWTLLRWFAFLMSAQFVTKLAFSEILSLTYLGNEGVLGTVLSVLSLIVGITMYFVGRKMKKGDRWKVLYAGNIPLLFVAFLLLFNTSPVVVILYLMVTSLASTTLWFVYFAVFSKSFETQGDGKLENNYEYILDHELISNFGRIVFVMLFFIVLRKFDQHTSVKVFIFGSAVMQMFALAVGKKLMDLQSSK